MLSLNPDFSQVEEAVSDISFSYSEKPVDDNRPFFVEGKDYISSNNEYFYSNRAADFDFGAKSFGRVGKSNYGLLATSAPDDRNDFAGRWLHELDKTLSAVGTLTATHQAEFDNILAVGQVDLKSKGLEYSLDIALTDTQTENDSEAPDGQGNHFKNTLGWKWNHWSVKAMVDQYDVEYFPALALLSDDLPGTKSGSALVGYYKEQSDTFWVILNSYAGIKERDTLDNELQTRKWFGGASVELESQIRVTANIEEGPYRPVTDDRGVFENFVNDDRYYSMALDLNTRSSVFSLGSRYDWGELGGVTTNTILYMDGGDRLFHCT